VRSNPILAGVACGAAIGLGALVVIDAATDTADAQSGFTVSAGQLRINQKISQAAVRRGNEALNLLRPVREAPGRPADVTTLDQSRGVRPGTGTGWQPGQIDVPALRSALGGTGQGPAGAQGPTGAQGPPGPTDGDADNSIDAPVFAEEVDLPFDEPNGPMVTTSVPGRLHVTASASISVECTTPYFWARAKIDGSPVRSSAKRFLASQVPAGVSWVPQDVTVSGVTDDVVPAGTHEVRMALGSATGTCGGYSGIDALHVSAIVLGG
jgi:hypothetical protein